MRPMQGVFWHGEIGFVVASHSMPSSFPQAREFKELHYDQVLLKLDGLPPLGPAPVASWLLARLFQLTRERLGFEPHDRLLNDGGGYYLELIAFLGPLRPIAFLKLHGVSSGIRLWGTCAADIRPDTVIDSFTNALASDPKDLMVCKIITIDTDPPDLPKRRFGKPHVFGWDGSKFLGFRRKPPAN